MAYNITTEPAASSSSPSTRQRKYDVFLSFRGEDTRFSVVDLLYSSLLSRGINTFRDDDQLQNGRDLPREISEAIEKSRISVIVFSKNYASSTWCLDELAKILECKKSRQQIVLPTFYDVDPSDVRHQRSTFGEAFVEHESRFKDHLEKVKGWRAALTEAANLSGFALNKDSRHASKYIHEITEEISQIFLDRPNLTYETNYLVGKDSRVREMNDLLGVGAELQSKGLNEAESPEKLVEDEDGLNEVGSLEITKADEAEPDDVYGVEATETNNGSPGGDEISPDTPKKDQLGDVTEPGSPGGPPGPADNDNSDRKGFSHWIFLIISLIQEIISAICDFFSSSEKPEFAVIGVDLAILALVICVSKLISKVRKRKFEFGRCRMCLLWFFCPERDCHIGTWFDLCELFGGIYGCVSSIVQCVYVLHLRKDNPFQVNLLPIVILLCFGGSNLLKGCTRCTKYRGSRSLGRNTPAENPEEVRISVSGSVEDGTVGRSTKEQGWSIDPCNL